MATSLPFRSRIRNTARATAAPVGLRLVATRAAGADRAVVVLAADLAGCSFAWCRQHAAVVLDAMVGQFPDQAVDVQLLDAENVPIYVASAAGGAS